MSLGPFFQSFFKHSCSWSHLSPVGLSNIMQYSSITHFLSILQGNAARLIRSTSFPPYLINLTWTFHLDWWSFILKLSIAYRKNKVKRIGLPREPPPSLMLVSTVFRFQEKYSRSYHINRPIVCWSSAISK